MNRFFDGFRFPFLNQDKAYPIEYDNALSSNEYLNKLMQYVKKWVENANKVLEDFDAELEHTSNKLDVIDPSADREKYPTVRAVYEYINAIETNPDIFIVDDSYTDFNTLWEKLRTGVLLLYTDVDPEDNTTRYYIVADKSPIDSRFNGRSISFKYYGLNRIIVKVISENTAGVEWHTFEKEYNEVVLDEEFNNLSTNAKTIVGAINEVSPIAKSAKATADRIAGIVDSHKVKTLLYTDFTEYSSFNDWYSTIPIHTTFCVAPNNETRQKAHDLGITPSTAYLTIFGIKVSDDLTMMFATAATSNRFFVGRYSTADDSMIWWQMSNETI